MASIDDFVGAMWQGGAPSVVLESGAALSDAELLAALREVAPPSLAFLLHQDGQVNFPYASPWGTVSILAERRQGITRASIVPARHPSANVGGPPLVFPAPRAAPPEPMEPAEWVSPPNDAPPARFVAPGVGCLPAAALSVACVLIVNSVTRLLGQDAGLLLVMLSSVAVFIDAHRLEARQGKLGGLANMGPWGWFLACLLLWGIGMPYYLLARPLLAQIKAEEDSKRGPWV